MKTNKKFEIHTEEDTTVPLALARAETSPAAMTTTPAETETLQQLREDSAERKRRAKSLVEQLTPQQFTTLLGWFDHLTLDQAVARVAAPPPEGFGIKTHRTTLQRLRSTDRALPTIAAAREILDTINDLEEHHATRELDRIQKSISVMLHQHAFELARIQPDSDILPRTIQAITRLAGLEHKRQQILLQREKLRLHTTRHHRVDLNIMPPVAATPPAAPAIEKVNPVQTITQCTQCTQ
jgi:hypothetical protein